MAHRKMISLLTWRLSIAISNYQTQKIVIFLHSSTISQKKQPPALIRFKKPLPRVMAILIRIKGPSTRKMTCTTAINGGCPPGEGQNIEGMSLGNLSLGDSNGLALKLQEVLSVATFRLGSIVGNCVPFLNNGTVFFGIPSTSIHLIHKVSTRFPPKSSIFSWTFHCKPTIFGVHHGTPIYGHPHITHSSETPRHNWHLVLIIFRPRVGEIKLRRRVELAAMCSKSVIHP